MSVQACRRLLLIEDDAGDARLLREMFNEPIAPSTQLQHVQSLGEAERYLAQHEVDVVLLDLGLPDGQGLAALRRAQAAAPRVPLVVLTGRDDEALAVQALQDGAQDYLVKGQIETRGLLRALRYAIERKVMEESLHAARERAQVTLGCIGEGVVCADNLGNVNFLNPAAETATGWSMAEAMGRPLVEVFRTRGNGSGACETTAEVSLLQIRGLQVPPACVIVRRDGAIIPIEQSIARIHNREGQAIGAVIVFRDVTAARAMALQIAHSAEHDFLTGLPNRMVLNDRIGQAISLAQRNRRQVAVLFLDLDGFKHINDSLGHPIGDQLLQSVATRLVSCVRGADTVSRQGGDEFIVLLSAVREAQAAATMAARILESVARAHSIEQHQLYITTSIGVSAYPEDGLDAETLIKNADTAMYQAKEGGRQGFRFFKPAMNERAVERQSIEESLRRALERDELNLHYQPIVCLRTRAIIGAEASAWWAHPTRGALSPGQFMPVAEDCGLILPIGNWLLTQACKQARAWADAGHRGLTMAVNVSAKQLADERFVDGLITMLAQTPLDPGALEIDLTESVLMRRIETTAAILHTLRARGVRVAVDDFGTGYSSLSYLRKFPVDALKVDRSFVRQISSSEVDAAIVDAVITMARSLKLRVMAEGVETQAELDFLQAHHCDQAQGDFFSQPIPAQKFAGLLSGRLNRLRV